MPVAPEWAIAFSHGTMDVIRIATIVNFYITISSPLKHTPWKNIHKKFGTKITIYFPLDALAILIFDQQDTNSGVSYPIVMVVIHFSLAAGGNLVTGS